LPWSKASLRVLAVWALRARGAPETAIMRAAGFEEAAKAPSEAIPILPVLPA
jgi:hypothetical protein